MKNKESIFCPRPSRGQQPCNLQRTHKRCPDYIECGLVECTGKNSLRCCLYAGKATHCGISNDPRNLVLKACPWSGESKNVWKHLKSHFNNLTKSEILNLMKLEENRTAHIHGYFDKKVLFIFV